MIEQGWLFSVGVPLCNIINGPIRNDIKIAEQNIRWPIVRQLLA